MLSRVCFNFSRTYVSSAMPLVKPLNNVDVKKYVSTIDLDKLFPFDFNKDTRLTGPGAYTERCHNLGALPRVLSWFFEEPIKKIVLTDTHISSYNNVEKLSIETIGPIKVSFDKLITRDPVLRQVIIPSKYNPGVYNIKYK
ncbi:hypothetical protein HOG98_03020 [bacterium]|jgi:hypothetical protein|nr:hypothetical protein [bacterium]